MYIMSNKLEAFIGLTLRRVKEGFGGILLLEGPPGGGKTSLAKELARRLGASLHYYSGAPDRERDLLYEVDVEGVLKREAAWVPGPAWTAFSTTKRGGFAVLLIDEVDKTSKGFDAFLLRLLEEGAFRSPKGEDIRADLTKLVVVLTTNGRRALRPEVMRRCQRVHVPLPTGNLLRDIIGQIAKRELPDGLISLLIRLGGLIREAGDEAPSPKELALCAIDLLALAQMGCQERGIWRDVSASWLIKEGGPARLDELTPFRWERALKREAEKGGVNNAG